MKKIIPIVISVLFIAISSCGKKKEDVSVNKENMSDNKRKVIDYLKAGSTISFGNAKYNLVWSSHPSDNYYKQEYLRENDTLDNFRNLILLEAILGTSTPKVAATSKASELKKMKETNPMVNYDLFEKDGEVMLDFLLSQQLPDGKDVVERNVYRYLPLKDKGGKTGVLLFGVSERAYGDEVSTFLVNLKQKKFDIPNAAGKFIVPEIRIEN